MSRIAPILGSVYFVFLGWYGVRFYGDDWRQDLLLGMLGLWALIAVVTHFYERRVRREIDALDPRAIAELRQADPDFDAFIADRPRINERVDWGWRAKDIAGGVALAFYPPFAYTVLRYRELTSDTPFDGIAVLLMLAGAGGYIVWRRRRLRRYRCPRCDGVPARLAGEQIRFACARCGVAWRLGQPVIGDGTAAAPKA